MLSKIRKCFWVAVLAALTLAGCGGGSDSQQPPPLTFTNGDAVPELTGVPVLPASWTAANGGSFDVTVPVDSDTTGVLLKWGVAGGITYNYPGSGSVALTPGVAQTATVTITPTNGATTPPSADYKVSVLLCSTATPCNFSNMGKVTWYTISTVTPSTYSKATWTGAALFGSEVNTGVAMPLMTVNAPAAPPLPFTNGNTVPELTGLPVLPASWTAANAATTPSFNVTVPVDSDTAAVTLMWGTNSGTTFTVQGSGTLALTPGAAQNAIVAVTPFNGTTTPPGAGYSVQVLLCNTAGVCDFSNTGVVALYMDSSPTTGTYAKNTWSGGTAGMAAAVTTQTGVAIPTMTVN